MGLKNPNEPKILLIDIETMPDLVWTWGVYQQNAIEVVRHWQVLSFSAEWISGPQKGQKITKGLPDYYGFRKTTNLLQESYTSDRQILIEIKELLEEADAVVAHNGVDFDMRKLNARFIAHKMSPPKPYKVIDTKREMARVAAFSSNKLDWISRQLELGRKLKHEGWDMWDGCIKGDPGMWRKMLRYNRHDIVLLKALYNELKPWIRLPNAAAFMTEKGIICPTCGGSKLQRRGEQVLKTRVYQRWQCQSCGAWSRSSSSQKFKKASIVPLDVNSRA